MYPKIAQSLALVKCVYGDYWLLNADDLDRADKPLLPMLTIGGLSWRDLADAFHGAEAAIRNDALLNRENISTEIRRFPALDQWREHTMRWRRANTSNTPPKAPPDRWRCWNPWGTPFSIFRLGETRDFLDAHTWGFGPRPNGAPCKGIIAAATRAEVIVTG